MNDQLRNRLYRALPEELVAAPATKANSNDAEYQMLTKSGRPLRQAARKAHGIELVQPDGVKKKLLTHGWIPEDQNYEPEYIHIMTTPEDPVSPDKCSSTNPTPSDTTPEDSHYEDNADQELDWDCSPQQIELVPPTHEEVPLLFTQQSETLIQPKPREIPLLNPNPISHYLIPILYFNP